MSEVIEWLRSPAGMRWSLMMKGNGGTEWSPMITLKNDLRFPESYYRSHDVGFRMKFRKDTPAECPV